MRKHALVPVPDCEWVMEIHTEDGLAMRHKPYNGVVCQDQLNRAHSSAMRYLDSNEHGMRIVLDVISSLGLELEE